MLNGTAQHIASLASDNSYAVVDLGGGTLTVNQNTDTVYRGIISGGGTFVKSGTGTLKINPLTGSVNSTGLLASAYDRIKVTGGMFDFSSFTSLPTAATRVDDMITLDGGGLRWSGSSTFTTTQSSVTTVSTNRGVVLGLGGGTIDVPNPYEIFIWQVGAEPTSGSMFSGDGGLTKTGPGFFRLGPGNTYKGKTKVLGGNLQFPRDDALGQAPDNFVDDQLFIDNGAMIQGNGTGIIKATRGMKIGAGGGVINGGTFIFNGKVSGPGALTKIGGGSISFNADNDTYSGITLTNGIIFFNGQESGGSGTITVDPLFNASIGKNEGPDNTISNPILLKDGSYIDMRVLSGTGTVVGSIYEGVPIGTLTLAGKITGPGQLFKGLSGGGSGNVILSNPANDFTGNLTISTGLLTVGANNALGSTAGSTTVNSLGTLVFKDGVNYTAPEPLYLSGPGNASIDGAVHVVSGANAFAGPVTLVANTVVNVDPGASLLLSGRVLGAPGAGLTKASDGKLILSGAGNTWSGDTNLQAGAIDFAATHRIGKLAFSGGATATLTPGNKLLRTTAVQFNDAHNADATLDLTDGRLIIDYSGASTQPLADAREEIITAYTLGNVPHWTGKGITSATAKADAKFAVGYAEASEIIAAGGNTWAGESNIDDTAVLVRTTLAGDATLDGTVDFNDLVKLAQNYNTTVSLVTESWWNHGDFTYDGITDFNDLVKLAQNYNTSLPSAPIPGAGPGFEHDLAAAFASVPEPSAALLAFFAACGFATSRRRRREK
jgi:autotransporter-associated beta strand protein